MSRKFDAGKVLFFKLYFYNYSFLAILYEFERKIMGHFLLQNLILVVLHQHSILHFLPALIFFKFSNYHY